jgi:hypothetical protein
MLVARVHLSKMAQESGDCPLFVSIPAIIAFRIALPFEGANVARNVFAKH